MTSLFIKSNDYYIRLKYTRQIVPYQQQELYDYGFWNNKYWILTSTIIKIAEIPSWHWNIICIQTGDSFCNISLWVQPGPKWDVTVTHKIYKSVRISKEERLVIVYTCYTLCIFYKSVLEKRRALITWSRITYTNIGLTIWGVNFEKKCISTNTIIWLIKPFPCVHFDWQCKHYVDFQVIYFCIIHKKE